MDLHPPFIISPRLLPAVKIDDVFISLDTVIPGERDQALFVIDFPDGTSHLDTIRSGTQGFASDVEAFDAFLGFLGACGEAHWHWGRYGGTKSDNFGLFPYFIGAWAEGCTQEIACLRLDMTIGEDDERLNHDLIAL